jgi:hypothetical protein
MVTKFLYPFGRWFAGIYFLKDKCPLTQSMLSSISKSKNIPISIHGEVNYWADFEESIIVL